MWSVPRGALHVRRRTLNLELRISNPGLDHVTTRVITMRTKRKELHGAEARAYADQHLQKVKENSESWEIEYVDPETGQKWVMDFPHGEYHGGGPPRLRLVEEEG